MDRIDEFLTINLLFLLLLRRFFGKLRFPLFIYLVLVSLFIGIISSLFSGTYMLGSLEELLLFLKGWTVGAIISTCSFEEIEVRKALLKSSFFISVVLLIGSILQITIGGWVYAFNTNEGSGLDSRWGMTALISFYNHPGVLAQISGIAACIIFSVHQSRKFDLIFFLGCCDIVICILTFRRRSIVALLFVLLLILFSKVFANRFVIFSMLIPLTILSISKSQFFLSSAYNELFDAYLGMGMRQARTALYQISPQIANDYFPLGSGLGTFGTYISSKNYSSIYSDYGLSGIWGLRPQDTFITDTFWPAVIGEMGWFGFSAFSLAIISTIALNYIRFFNSNDSRKDLYLCCFLVGLYLLVDSIAAPTFLVAPVAPIFGIFAGLGYALRKKY